MRTICFLLFLGLSWSGLAQIKDSAVPKKSGIRARFLERSFMETSAPKDDLVVLLHGLARTSRSMKPMERALRNEGYEVHNLSYPSRKYPIETLSISIGEEMRRVARGKVRVHVVTHSMGGIILRYLQKTQPLENLGRVVMLSPPNQGSEVVDKLGRLALFRWINGPAGSQLGTSPVGLVKSLGPVDFELGVITGDRSINWILSLMIPGKDDGKVSIESAKVVGLRDYQIVHASHPLIMRKKKVIRATLNFLRSGKLASS